MPDERFWRQRFKELGPHSVGPGNTQDGTALEEHRQYFVRGLSSLLPQLIGPVLDFGCGVGRWVVDLPRPYVGLDLLPEHIQYCKERFKETDQTEFRLSSELGQLPVDSFGSVFSCTVIQHIVEPELRHQILAQLYRVLAPNGIFLAVEWAEGQRNFDWCQAVKYKDFKGMPAKSVGEVIENGRKHTIWVVQKPIKRKLFVI